MPARPCPLAVSLNLRRRHRGPPQVRRLVLPQPDYQAPERWLAAAALPSRECCLRRDCYGNDFFVSSPPTRVVDPKPRSTELACINSNSVGLIAETGSTVLAYLCHGLILFAVIIAGLWQFW